MSDFALNVNIYDLIRRYSDLLENVILSLKTDSSFARSAEVNELADFLNKLVDENNLELSIKLISSILTKNLKWKDLSSTLKSLAIMLKSGQVNEKGLDRLEDIAEVLDKECAQTISRIRGNY